MPERRGDCGQRRLVRSHRPGKRVLAHLRDEVCATDNESGLRATDELVAAERHDVRTGGKPLAGHRLVGEPEASRVDERTAAEIVHDDRAVTMGQFGHLARVGNLDEAALGEVRRVHPEHEPCAPIGQRLREVCGAGPIGGADLDKPCARPPDDLGDTHATADLDQFAPADGHAAAARKTDGERHGRRVVVRDEGVLGTGQLHQRVLGGSVAVAPSARLPVELEQQVGSGRLGADRPRLLWPGRPPEVRVDDHAGRIDDRDEPLAPPMLAGAEQLFDRHAERPNVAWRLARTQPLSLAVDHFPGGIAQHPRFDRPVDALADDCQHPFDARGSGSDGLRHRSSLAGAHGSRTHRATPSAASLVLKTRGATGPQPPPVDGSGI